jgi:S-adenosylmethionine-dependent methyltransferase
VTDAEVFDSALRAWLDWQDAPWGRIRYAVVATNLARHLPSRPLRIADIGGGTGADAILLAGQGHEITLLDYSAAMLAEAERRFGAAGLAERLTIVQADADAVPAVLEAHAYDLVLCHNVLPYVADAFRLLADCAGVVRPGGLLSVTSTNADSEVLRTALHDQDLVAAYAAIGATQAHTALFDTPVTRHTPGAVIELLESVGARVIGHYGVRTICDYLADDARKSDPTFYAELERVELALADRMPYPWIARMFHLIARV